MLRCTNIKKGPGFSGPLLYNKSMYKFIVLFSLVLLWGCSSHKRHMNEVFAHYVEKVHVACQTDTDCAAVLKSCHYPEWGYTAINRRELEDFNRIREADWYTRCKKQPDTSAVQTACRNNRCVLVKEEESKYEN